MNLPTIDAACCRLDVFLFKLVGSLTPHCCAYINVVLDESALKKGHDAVNLFEFHPQPQVKFETSSMNDILLSWMKSCRQFGGRLVWSAFIQNAPGHLLTFRQVLLCDCNLFRGQHKLAVDQM